jgi:hypothetical protein
VSSRTFQTAPVHYSQQAETNIHTTSVCFEVFERHKLLSDAQRLLDSVRITLWHLWFVGGPISRMVWKHNEDRPTVSLTAEYDKKVVVVVLRQKWFNFRILSRSTVNWRAS